MNVKQHILLLLGAVLLTTGACEKKETAGQKDDSRNPSRHKEDENWAYSTLYETLANGWNLYLGTVGNIEPEPNRHYMDWGGPAVEEQGVLQFKVEKTLFGNGIPEFRTRYMYSRADVELASDWPSGHVWDDYPPKRGLRLAVLASGKKDEDPLVAAKVGEGKVTHMWEAPRGDPFIQDLAKVCAFLTAKEGKDRIRIVKDPVGLVQSVGGSKFPTIRILVRKVVFGADPGVRFPEPEIEAASPELVLAFIRISGLTVKSDRERAEVTGDLGLWFRIPDHFKAAPKELRSAFEDWYIADLEAGNKGGTKYEGGRTVIALYDLQAMCKANGVKETVGLFQQAGRAGLVQRAEACLHTPQETSEERVHQRAQELLDLLNAKP
jgi:hypothetical protein